MGVVTPSPPTYTSFAPHQLRLQTGEWPGWDHREATIRPACVDDGSATLVSDRVQCSRCIELALENPAGYFVRFTLASRNPLSANTSCPNVAASHARHKQPCSGLRRGPSHSRCGGWVRWDASVRAANGLVRGGHR
jgi:hypothetical protein